MALNDRHTLRSRQAEGSKDRLIAGNALTMDDVERAKDYLATADRQADAPLESGVRMSIWTARNVIQEKLRDFPVPELMRASYARLNHMAFDIALALDEAKMLREPMTRWEHFKRAIGWEAVDAKFSGDGKMEGRNAP